MDFCLQDFKRRTSSNGIDSLLEDIDYSCSLSRAHFEELIGDNDAFSELASHAADAFEQASFHSVQDEPFLEDTKDFEVKIKHDPAEGNRLMDTWFVNAV